jgi:hydrogenase expression/formation protein HypC
MCLAIPGRVLSIEGEDPAFRSGRVDFCGVYKTVDLALTPEVVAGDFVLVHVGIAVSKVDAAEAVRTHKYLAQILEEAHLSPMKQGDVARPTD